MASNKVKVGITADVDELVKSTKKAQESVQKLGTESTKTAKNIKTISGAANAEKRVINELALQYHNLTDAEKMAYGADIKRQMDAHIAKLREYKAVQADINNQIGGVTSSFGKFGNVLGQVGSKMGLPIGNLTALLNPTTAAIAGVAALGAAFVATAKKTEQFDSELNNLSTRLNVPKDQLKEFGDEAIEIGNKFGVAGEEIVKQFNFISQQLPGIENNKQGLFDLTEAVNTLSIGMGTDLETATNGVVTAMSKWNLSAGEAMNVANAMAETSRNSGASLDYQAAVFEKVGSAAKAVNIPYTDIAAATGVLSSSFADASQVGTGLLAMINKLGKQKDEFNPAVVGLQTAVENLKNAHLSYSEIAGMVGPKAAQVVSVLIEQGDKFDELAEKTKNTQAAQDMFGVKSEELGFIINKVKNMWQNFLLKIGESQVFQTIMGIIKDVMTWIEELSADIQELFSSSDSGSGFAQMWDQIREAIKAVLPILGAVIKAYLLLQDTIMAVVSWVIENVVSGVELIISCFTDIYNEASSIFTAVKDFIVDIWHKAVDPVVDFVKKVMDWLSTLWNNVKGIFNAIWDKITSIFRSITKPIASVINKISGFFKSLWNNIKNIFNSIYKKISNTAIFRAIVKVYEWFKDRATAILKVIADAWNKFVDFTGIGSKINLSLGSAGSGGGPPSANASDNTPDPSTKDVQDNGGGGGSRPSDSNPSGGGGHKGGSSGGGGHKGGSSGGGGHKGSSGSSNRSSSKPEPEEGTLSWYDKKIQDLQKSLNEVKHTDEEIAGINKQIADYTEKRKKEHDRIFGTEKNELKSVEDYEKEISRLNERLKKEALSDNDVKEITREIVNLERTKNRMTAQQTRQKQLIEFEATWSDDTLEQLREKFGDRLEFYIDIFKDAKTDKEVLDIAAHYQNVLGQIVKMPEPEDLKLHVKTIDDRKREKYDTGTSILSNLQNDYDIGLIDEDTFLQRWNVIKEAIEAEGLTVDVKPELKSTKQFNQNLEDINSAVSSIGDTFSSIGDMTDDPAMKVASIVAQSIANIALGAGKAMAQAGELGPWGWIAFGAGIMAQMAAMIAQVHSATGFAEGGIIKGSTTMGDQILARVNTGEMILNNRQQQHLFNALDRGIEDDTSSSPTVTTVKVSGSDLYLALKNYGKITNKKTF